MDNLPQQENGSDCGVFLCAYAEAISRNAAMCFEQVVYSGSTNLQSDMVYWRIRISHAIQSGQLI